MGVITLRPYQNTLSSITRKKDSIVHLSERRGEVQIRLIGDQPGVSDSNEALVACSRAEFRKGTSSFSSLTHLKIFVIPILIT